MPKPIPHEECEESVTPRSPVQTSDWQELAKQEEHDAGLAPFSQCTSITGSRGSNI